MKCSKCGSEIPEGNAFCNSCGTPVEAKAIRFCTNCGAEVPDGMKFCVSCGTPVDAPADAPAPANEPAPAADTQPVSATSIPAATPTPVPAAQAAPQPVIPAQPSATKQMPPVQNNASYSAQVNSPKKSGSNTGLIVGIIVAAVVLIIAIVCVVVFVVKPGASPANTQSGSVRSSSTTVPNVVSKDVTSATNTLSAAGYTVKITYVDGEKDVVLEQSPRSGSDLKSGSEVLLSVGKGTTGTREVDLTVTNPRNGQVVSSMITLNINDEVIPDLLSRRYSRAEIEAMNLSDAELYIARNSIVAHQGYIFKYQPNTEFFRRNCSWYNPVYNDYNLTGIPSDNATTILEIEKARNSWYPEIK